MSYTITAQIYQTSQNALFRIVEKTVYTDGTWSEVDGAHVFTMGYSGTSGSLRFMSDTNENFIVTLGIHNYKRWGDIVTNLTVRDTGVIITPQYYSDKYPAREQQREAQLESYNVNNAQCRNFSFIYTIAEGSNLTVKIIIG